MPGRQITEGGVRGTPQGSTEGAASAAPSAPGTRPPLPPLGYVPFRRSPLRRLAQLLAGLALYGLSLSVLVRASLGVNPWSVLYEGIGRRTDLSFGAIGAAVGAAVLLLWIPLRRRPTFGTAANIVVLAYASDLGLRLIPPHLGLPARIALPAAGVLLNGFSVAVYVGARLGPGPRDGLMTGVCAATGWSVRLVRTLMETTVCATGWLLGGSVGAGTVLYACAVGPITQFFLPRFAYQDGDASRRSGTLHGRGPDGGQRSGAGCGCGHSVTSC